MTAALGKKGSNVPRVLPQTLTKLFMRQKYLNNLEPSPRKKNDGNVYVLIKIIYPPTLKALNLIFCVVIIIILSAKWVTSKLDRLFGYQVFSLTLS